MQLFDYQRKAVEFVKDKKRCAIFYEMGLGKTLIALTAIAEIKPKQTLVVAPKPLAVNVWQSEISKWDHTKHLTSGLFLGSDEIRKKTLKEDPDIIICGIDNIKHLPSPQKKKYEMIVIDESGKFKRSASQRFALFKKFPQFAEYVVIMSGTPITESLEDIWSQMYLLDRGKTLDEKKLYFLRKYFYEEKGENHNFSRWKEREGAREKVIQKISEVCIVEKLRDHVDLKTPVSMVVNLNMSDKTRRRYNQMKRDFIIEGLTNLSVANAGVMVNKLLQICNGFIYNEDQVANLHNDKVEMLAEILDQTESNSLLITKYKEDEKMIKKKISYAKPYNDENLKLWNQKKIKVMYLNPKSCGHGLNLQYGGSNVIWYSLTYSLEEYEQTNARLIRRGQTDAVKIIHLITRESIEEKIMDKLKNKIDSKTQIIKLLKEEINK